MEKPIEIEVKPEYIKKMQKEGMFDKMDCKKPEFPDCPYYMQGYNSVK